MTKDARDQDWLILMLPSCSQKHRKTGLHEAAHEDKLRTEKKTCYRLGDGPYQITNVASFPSVSV